MQHHLHFISSLPLYNSEFIDIAKYIKKRNPVISMTGKFVAGATMPATKSISHQLVCPRQGYPKTEYVKRR